jgi:hypothetical protein
MLEAISNLPDGVLNPGRPSGRSRPFSHFLYCIISGDCGAIDTARHEDNTDVGSPALGRLLRQEFVL